MLEIKNLGVSFGGLRAVNDFNLYVGSNELIGLIGPNGAGKTTIFNLLTGVYQPTEGGITLNNESLYGKKTYMIAKKGISRTFQNIRLFKSLSVIDNVKIGMYSCYKYSILDSIFKTKKYRQVEKNITKESLELLKIFDLDKYAKDVSSSLSYGKQRELEIVRALASHPKILLLDEPAAGMNPNETINLMKLIKKIKNEFNLSIILIEHDMKLVMNVCERIIVLNHGEVLTSGSAKEILEDKNVIKAYLGA